MEYPLQEPVYPKCCQTKYMQFQAKEYVEEWRGCRGHSW